MLGVSAVVFLCANGVLGVVLLARGVRRSSASTFCTMPAELLRGVRNPNTSFPDDSPASCNCLDLLKFIDTVGTLFVIM